MIQPSKGEVNVKIKGEFILREIAGDTILVPVGQTAMEFNGMITLEPVGAMIWKDIQAGKNKSEILDHILNTFEVESQVAEKDLEEFLLQLRQNGFLE